MIDGMLETALGDDHYPGDVQPSANWPGFAPGRRGVNNALSPKYLDQSVIVDVEPDGNPDSTEACDGCPVLDGFDYTIPADNPFVGDPAFAPEIYTWGVRNPWRFARDPETDLIYVGDVGQGEWEEVSIISSGADLGWSTMEGFHCFNGPCDTTAGPNQVNADGMTMPLIDYGHTGQRCSVTGLSVYRSCQVPGWDGVYFYADYCTSEVFALSWDGANVTDLGEVFSFNERIIGNGWNAYGDVLVTTVEAVFGMPIVDGRVYRIAPG